MNEHSIISARASVMIYDDGTKKWVPSGTSSGLSKVQIYQHTVQQTFRVVGRKLQNHEVVINCAILKGLKYNQATATFHQWRDNKHVYGLNFSSKEDADAFARAMFHSLDVLSNAPRPPSGQYAVTGGVQQPQIIQQQPQPPQPPHHQQPPQQLQYEEDMGYRTMTREDVAAIQERRISSSLISPQQTSPMNNSMVAPVSSPAPPINAPPVPSPVSPPSVSGSGHQRTTSAPPAPAPPPPPMMSTCPPAAPPAPAPPMIPPPVLAPPPAVVAGPPPPPPPPMNISRSQSSDGGEVNSLAMQLQNARLKRSKNTPPPAENSGSSTSSGGSSNYGTLGRGGGGSMASMMDEMAKTLARRRAAVEKKTPDNLDEDEKKASWEKTNTLPSNSSKFSSSESPKSIRKRFGSASEETILKVNGLNEVSGLCLGPVEMESLKNEIVKEIKKELTKMKQDILEAIKSELNRR